MKRCVIGLAVLMAAGIAATAPLQARPVVTDPTPEIRQALLWLPYYGPFDAISFRYDKGTVTLEGSAYAPGLKAGAERAVTRVPGVDTVINNIEPLPASDHDDDLRWKTFYAIYGNAFLSRYAPAGGLARWNAAFLRRERELGLEPFGQYPIHIIVRNGRIDLMGVVDNQADRTAAELAARGVSGSFGVEDHLQVYSFT